jgi:hypothetical protein
METVFFQKADYADPGLKAVVCDLLERTGTP